MSNRTRIAVAVSVVVLPLALVACSGSSSSTSSSSPSPSPSDVTYSASPPTGVQPITVVVTPGSVNEGGTAVVQANAPITFKDKLAYIVTVDKELPSQVWAKGVSLDADGAGIFKLEKLQRTYDFRVVVPTGPLKTKEFPAGIKLLAASAVFPVKVIEP